MGKCGCGKSSVIGEEVDSSEFEETELTGPTILNYKKALRNLSSAIKSASKSSDGKKLPEDYWTSVVQLLKKAKLGISMLELGIDDDEPLSVDTKDTKDAGDIEITPMGDTRDGDKQSDNFEDEKEQDAADAEKDDGKEKESPPEKKKEDSEEDEKKKPKKESVINEKAKSAAQQRLFGMVHAYKNGELDKSEVDDSLWDKIKQIAKGISGEDAEDIAKTKHDDLPEKAPTDESEKKKETLDDVRHLGTILESDNFKIVSVNHFDIGLVVEVRKDDKTHILTLGNIVTLEGDGYSFDLGSTANFGTIADKFKKLVARGEYELLHEYQRESNA
jgi:hypothetical protein